MFHLSKQLRKPSPAKASLVRDTLIANEMTELTNNLPSTTTIIVPDPNQLYNFDLIICPDTGFWRDGRFRFQIYVPDEYNMAAPKIKCKTRVWHPNVNEQGDVCLGLWRWSPSMSLKDVVFGLGFLFTDLANFNEPINLEAAEQYKQNEKDFQCKVSHYVQLYAQRREILTCKRRNQMEE